MINEEISKWSQIIKEELGIENKEKLDWMSKYARNHEVYEAVQAQGYTSGGITATPLNTLGIGNPMSPMGTGFNAGGHGTGIGNDGSDFHAYNYKVGSGDIPMSTLSMSLEVFAQTIGLELVPVIPSNGPWLWLQYMDFPYAGGKLGRLNETVLDGKGEGKENKPIYIKVTGTIDELRAFYATAPEKGAHINFVGAEEANNGYTLHASYIGKSRIDNGIIAKVLFATADGTEEGTPVSIADVFGGSVTIAGTDEGSTVAGEIAAPHPDVISGAADHVQEFGNFAVDGSDDGMTRAQNETGVGNTIGARFFTKMVQMQAFEVTGTVTRQQLQDMPLYGVDVVGKVLEAMQNELSQDINNRILDRVFKLGVTNAVQQKQYQSLDLNLYFGAPSAAATKDLKDFSGASKFIGIDGVNYAKNWGAVASAIQNTAAENITTHQRRIASRILAAANIIANVSRWGRANWVVTNTQVLTALQDSSQFVIAPMVNTMTQDGSQSLYFAGSIAGLNVYVDPYMTWDDTRVCVGRKSNGTSPGVVFCPYILCDQVQITAEGTMAPKLLCNSRFAIVDAGFHPEQNYLTFMVDTSDQVGII